MPGLPTYKSQVQLTKSGDIGFDNLRYEIQSGRSLNVALDKVSEWAFGKWKAETEEKATKFAIENPPNAEDLQKLVSDYISPPTGKKQEDQLVELQKAVSGLANPSNVREGTVFADALKKARILQIKASLSAIGQETMAMYSSLIESGVDDKGEPINLNSVRKELNARINGLTSAMSQVDLKAANILNAELISYANPIYNKAISAISAAVVAKQGVAIDLYVKNAGIQFSNWMQNIDNNGKLNDIDANKAIHALSDNVMSNVIFMAGMDPQMVKHAIDLTTKEMAAAKVAAMTTYFSSPAFAANAPLAVKRLRNGDAGKLASIYAALTSGEVDNVIKEIYKIESDRLIAEARIDTSQKVANQHEFVRLYVEWIKAPPSEQDALRDQMVPLAGTTDQVKLLFDNNREDNLALRVSIYTQMLRNRDTGVSIITKNANKLSKGDIDFLMEQLSQFEKTDYMAGVNVLRQAAQVDDRFNFLNADEAKRNAQLFIRYMSLYNEMVKNIPPGKPANYLEIADRILGAKVSTGTVTALPPEPKSAMPPETPKSDQKKQETSAPKQFPKAADADKPALDKIGEALKKKYGKPYTVNPEVLSDKNLFNKIRGDLDDKTLSYILSRYPRLK